MSKNKVAQHLLDAVESIAKSQIELTQEFEKHEKILGAHATEIAELQLAVKELRDKLIVEELRHTPGKDVAERYNLSPSRISQIKKENEN